MQDEEIILKIKMILLSILMVLISFIVFFFIAVIKVDASSAIGGYNGTNDTQGVWWSDTNYDYRCGWSNSSTLFCGTFDRALAILYNYQPSTSDTLTFSASIYTQADYMSSKVWNNQVYVLWGYQSNLYYDWSLQDSCTIDGSQTTEHINSLTDRKLFYVTINCTASPPISGAYPVIYNLQRFSNDTYGGLSNYNFNLGYVTGTITQNTNSTDIINNQNQNTQQQIENANKNKDEIIANQNENTDKITDAIDNQNKNCQIIDNSLIIEKGYLNNSGTITNSNTIGVTNYIKIKESKITIIKNNSSLFRLCFYDNTKNKIDCKDNRNYSVGDEIPVPNNAYYVRISISITDTPIYEICGKNHDYGSQPDSSDTNSYMNKEDQLMGYMEESDIDDIDIDIDLSATGWIWTMLDRLIRTHTALFTTVLAILGLGIIKLVLNR